MLNRPLSLSFASNQGTVNYCFGSTFHEVTYVEVNACTFKPANQLGEGAHCKAQRYTSDRGESIVLKSPLRKKPSLTEATEEGVDADRIHSREVEISYINKVYPGTYFVHKIALDTKAATLTPATSYQTSYVFFVIMPFIDGVTLDKAVQAATSEKELLEIYLAVATELKRIHNLGILHGDINNGNILISPATKTQPTTATFIDFEWAYSITDTWARKARCSQRDCNYFPRERTTDISTTPPPNFNQEMYSLGWWLYYNSFTFNPHLAPACVTQFYRQALNVDPSLRPTLDSFIMALQAGQIQLAAIMMPDDVENEEVSSKKTTDNYSEEKWYSVHLTPICENEEPEKVLAAKDEEDLVNDVGVSICEEKTVTGLATNSIFASRAVYAQNSPSQNDSWESAENESLLGNSNLLANSRSAFSAFSKKDYGSLEGNPNENNAEGMPSRCIVS